VDTVLVAEAADFEIVLGQPRLIVSAHSGIPLEPDLSLAFAIHQGQAAQRKGGIDFLPRQDLDRRDIEIKGTQQIEPLLIVGGGHEEV
jgi:hypothetical protein